MLSKTSLQAVKACCELGRVFPNSSLDVKTIAAKIQAPQNYLGKLLQNLAVKGILVSQKGKGGGFQLQQSPQSTSLYVIVNSIENIDRWEGCFMGRSQCGEGTCCQAHQQWAKVREEYLKFLKGTTLADLF